jgi:ABC-type multidrug transport system ATPase subunit
MMLGLAAPTAGSVRLFGAPPSQESRRRLGYLPQGTGLWLDLSVAENLAFVAGGYGVTPPALDAELAAVGERPVGEIPLGLRRRVAFAAALCHQPEVVLLDEPTSGVGPLGRAALWETITSAAAAGAAVLVTTHHMEEAELCDRLVMMAAGRAVASGTAADLAGSVTAVEVTAEDWRAAFDALVAGGLTPTTTGSLVRVAGADPGTVDEVLTAAGVGAGVRPVPARFDEAFVALAS